MLSWPGLFTRIQNAPVIVADNIARYCYDEGGHKQFKDWQRDLFAIAPPFETMWIEWTDIPDNSDRYRAAAYWDSRRREDGSWNIMVLQFVLPAGKPLPVLYSCLQLNVDAGGACMNLPLKTGMGNNNFDPEVMFVPSALTVQFMNCTNVETILTGLPTASRSGSRKRKVTPTTRYYVLQIDAMTTKRVGGGVEREADSTALHICRGHFKDYREKGIFGKNHGVYWWADHARGSGKNGHVVKDYAIGALA